ncbi:hypothetical protein SBA4_4550017 [Candidatus Sulfopaludibacter sp. SbA4]|nr:hypothetical protein SBA4_4550017 [Candidatus Sulfopaludibacter sp. SbA4]
MAGRAPVIPRKSKAEPLALEERIRRALARCAERARDDGPEAEPEQENPAGEEPETSRD